MLSLSSLAWSKWLKIGAVFSNQKLKRLLEVIPGSLTWLAFILPIVFSFFLPVAVALAVIIFDLYWLFRALRLTLNAARAYLKMRKDTHINWWNKIRFNRVPHIDRDLSPLISLQYRSSEIYQAIIVVHYKESCELLENSIQTYAEAHFPKERKWLILASEERNGKKAKEIYRRLFKKFKNQFGLFHQTIHPAGLKGEIKCKSANATWGAKYLKSLLDKRRISYSQVLINNFDADTRVHPQYFAYLTYQYLTTPLGQPVSYQPIHIYSNNIWETPAIMRIVAQSSTLIFMHNTFRPARFHCFSSRSDVFQTIVDIGFWAVDAIPEDSRQYYDATFYYRGRYRVQPLYIPLRMDAVLAEGYWRTVQNQYRQLRRWAWGVVDFSYVIFKALADKYLSFWRKLFLVIRLLESHFSWATASIYIAFMGWVPLILNPKFSDTVLAYNLPLYTRTILTLALIGLIATLVVSFLLLPPRPGRHPRVKYLAFIFQWFLVPIVSIFLSSLAAIDSQTRLMFGRYLEYQVTEKAVIKEGKGESLEVS